VDDIKVLVAGQKRGVPKKEKPWMGRRNSVEHIIGHLKSDGKLRRCFLKGVLGDAINVTLSACGQNLRKLLKWLYCAPYFGAFLRRLWLKITFYWEDPKVAWRFLLETPLFRGDYVTYKWQLMKYSIYYFSLNAIFLT
jgi:transposase, IS5 family